jgi:5-methylthioribose kinase
MELLADQAAAVEAHLRRLGWIEEREQITALEIPGQGNMNRLLRVRLDSRSFILKQAVPYVARYPQIPAPVTRLAAEAAFYRAIAPHPELRRHTPALLGEDQAEHLLCLEDLGTGGDLTRLYAEGPGTRHEQTLSVLTGWLGKLHGLTIDAASVPPNGAMRELNHAHIFQVPLDPDNGVALSASLGDHQRRLAGDAALRARARSLGQIYLGAAGHESRPVLLHGDFYPGSWLEHAEQTVAVIDPEFGFAGPAEFDVGVFMAHLIMSGYSPTAVDTAVQRYQAPPGFSAALAAGFAGMEVIRRLLGVAQLPLHADDDTRSGWLQWARCAVLE